MPLSELDRTFRVSTWVLLRTIFLSFALTFVSSAVQMAGLFGSSGITPLAPELEEVAAQLGTSRFWELPTVFWWGSTDQILWAVPAAGVIFSVIGFIGFLELPMLLASYLLYLSIFTAGGVLSPAHFYSFQWDSLLLETGFVGLFLVPLRSRSRLVRMDTPSKLQRALILWLAFRLMFMSGAVKLLSGDPTWRDLSALCFHYETQPLPTPFGYFMANLPCSFNKVTTLFVFFVEIIVPFGLFGPKSVRRFSALLLITLQVLIALTGNYAFFNVLTAGICFASLDDEVFRRFVRLPRAKRHRQTKVAAALSVILICVSTLVLVSGRRPAKPIEEVIGYAERWGITSTYGLFAVMTISRHEIVIEGSDDGKNWRSYEFRYKPGDLNRMPPVVAPHQPRLDWQMWFAALGTVRENSWVVLLTERLLQGSKPVLDLLEKNPFPDRPPQYIRGEVYDYHFVTMDERAKTGAWWKRTYVGPYFPPLTLEQLSDPAADSDDVE